MVDGFSRQRAFAAVAQGTVPSAARPIDDCKWLPFGGLPATSEEVGASDAHPKRFVTTGLKT